MLYSPARKKIDEPDSTKKLDTCQQESIKISDSPEKAYNQALFRRVCEITGASGAEALSERLNVARSTAFQWQRGDRPIPLKYLVRLSEQYGKPLESFYRGVGVEAEKDQPPGVFEEIAPYGAADPDEEEFARVLSVALKVRRLPVDRQLELDRQLGRELRRRESQMPPPPAATEVIEVPGLHKERLPEHQQRPRRAGEKAATMEDVRRALEKKRKK